MSTQTSPPAAGSPRFGLLARKDGGKPVKVRRISTFFWRKMEFFVHAAQWKSPDRKTVRFYKVSHARTGVSVMVVPVFRVKDAEPEARRCLNWHGTYKRLRNFPAIKENNQADRP